MRLLIARLWVRIPPRTPALLAQSGERATVNREVVGSKPARGVSRDGAGEARKAHNLEVDGSKPSLAS